MRSTTETRWKKREKQETRSMRKVTYSVLLNTVNSEHGCHLLADFPKRIAKLNFVFGKRCELPHTLSENGISTLMAFYFAEIVSHSLPYTLNLGNIQ